MSMRKVKISDFAEVITGGTPSTSISEYWENGTIPWLQSGACQNCIITDCNTFITQAGLENSAAKMMHRDSVLIALTGATTGKVGYLTFEACANQSVTGIQPNDNFVPKYLYYYLLGIRKKILDDSYGGAQKHISQGYVKNIEVPLGTITEQNDIVEILERVDKVIALRKQELQSLDDLIKARFVEMFGDQKCEKKQLIELIQEGAGLSYGIVVPGDNVADGIPMVRPSDFKNGSLNLDNVYRVASEIECKYKKTRLLGDEILVQVIGQPGQVMLSDERCKGMNVTRNLAVIRIDKDKADRLFISHYLTTEEAQRFMFGSTNQSTLKQLPLNKLKELPVPLVPLSKQGQFAEFVKQIDKSKVVAQQALDESQLLFDSLMQKYFG